jgi:hypothetical protein
MIRVFSPLSTYAHCLPTSTTTNVEIVGFTQRMEVVQSERAPHPAEPGKEEVHCGKYPWWKVDCGTAEAEWSMPVGHPTYPVEVRCTLVGPRGAPAVGPHMPHVEEAGSPYPVPNPEVPEGLACGSESHQYQAGDQMGRPSEEAEAATPRRQRSSLCEHAPL